MREQAYFLLMLLLLLCSCKDFETKRVRADAIYEEELKQIDWKSIEVYPTFRTCEEFSGNERQICFKQQFSKHIYEYLSTKQVILSDSLEEQVWLYMNISKTGKPQIDSTDISESLLTNIPTFEAWLHEAVQEMPKIYPAQKRGVPVATHFKLPLKIQTKRF